MAKADILNRFDRITKGINKVMPETSDKIAPVIRVGGFKGKKYEFKFQPRNVLEFAEQNMNYKFLSDAQKKCLLEIFGPDPETWDTEFSEFIFLIGQGGGKNTIVEIAVNYCLSYLINPLNVYEVFSDLCRKQIPHNSDFEVTNNSMVGATQARTVFFDRMKSVMRNTIDPESGENLYQKYMNFDLREEGMGDIKSKVIEFPSFFKNSGCIKLHSLDSGIATFEGKSIILSLADEPSRANTQPLYDNAKLLYNGLSGNISTRFPNGVAKLIAFSYPNTSEYDLTYELAMDEVGREREAKESGKPYIPFRKVFIFSTFQFNPSVRKTDKKIANMYLTNPDEAMARYECIKSKSQFAFFKPHIEKIGECAIRELQNRVTYVTVNPEKSFKDNTTKGYTGIEIYEIKGDNKFRCWAADASSNKDRFWLMSGYNESVEAGFGNLLGETNPLPSTKRPIIDLIITWAPSKKYPVDYANVYQVVDRLLTAFPNSAYYKSDKFQSEGLASIFENRGIKAKMIGFSNSEQVALYSTFRLAVFNLQVGYLYNPLLIEELERVQRANKTQRISHPQNFCFTGDTRVALIDGTNPTFEELYERFPNGESFYVYSMSPEGVCMGKACNPRKTGLDAELVEVTLDNFNVIRCTPSHLFMTLDGEYIQAKNLNHAVRLMPLYRVRSFGKGWYGYEQLYCPIKKQSKILTHHMVAKQFYGGIPTDHIVHHINRNKWDNRPENLEVRCKYGHARQHTKERHETDEEYVKKLRAGHKFYRENGGNEKSRANILSLLDRGILKRGREKCAIEGCERLLDARGLCDMHYQRAKRAKVLPLRVAKQQNHRVISVKTLTKKEDVWDITVEKYHNFALASGVYVHNSKDGADVLVQMYEMLTSQEFIQCTDFMGVDRFRDEKLIELADQVIRVENTARQRGLTQLGDYVCEVLGITMADYKKIKTVCEIYFPTGRS